MSRADVMRLLPEPDLDRVERLYEETMETAHAMRLAMVEIQATTRLAGLHQELSVGSHGSNQLARLYATCESGDDEFDPVAASELVGKDTDDLADSVFRSEVARPSYLTIAAALLRVLFSAVGA